MTGRNIFDRPRTRGAVRGQRSPGRSQQRVSMMLSATTLLSTATRQKCCGSRLTQGDCSHYRPVLLHTIWGGRCLLEMLQSMH